MRQVIAVLWQSVLLFLAALVGFGLGISVPALRVYRVLSHTASNTRTYDFDWLIAVLLVYVLLLVIGAARKRLRGTVATATIALVIVLSAVILFTQLGIKNTAT
jgi:hypothetical protein